MALFEPNQTIPYTIRQLVRGHIPSRFAKGDTSFFCDPKAQSYADNFIGWRTLASKPPYPIADITSFASEIIAEGLDKVILLGQGGSTQAAMTITKLARPTNSGAPLFTLDSLSPVYIHKALEDTDFSRTMVIVSSKSGTTLETLSLFRVMWLKAQEQMGKAPSQRFIAITDKGSKLQQLAESLHFRKVFFGEKNVGGRFSALSVFGLVPAALTGVDIEALITRAAETEKACQKDSEKNPAVELAAFLYDNVDPYSAFAFSYISPQPGRVFGLWIEQMIAESLGKDGSGILPQIEIDPELLNPPYPRRPVVVYRIRGNEKFDYNVKLLSELTPTKIYEIKNAQDIGSHFMVWEYATAFLGYLLKISPFDQPDVSLSKELTQKVLLGGLETPFKQPKEDWFSYQISQNLQAKQESDNLEPFSLSELLRLLFSSTRPYDFFSVNAFLPFINARRDPIESIRHTIARDLGVPTCLEIGSRYLHSTGQLHKGGHNSGVFLIVSANEENDIAIPDAHYTLGELAVAQARGDMAALNDKGRRALHIHLEDNHPDTLWKLAGAIATSAAREARRVSFLVEK